jgi:IclR family acetate operon transcriptional repressor
MKRNVLNSMGTPVPKGQPRIIASLPAGAATFRERNPVPFACIVLRVKAVERTLSVLEALGRPRPLADIAERTGLPKPTVHRILQVLVARGFARDAEDGVYAAGPRVLTVAGEALAELDLAGLARPTLTALQRSVGGTVHLALRNGDEAVYVEKIESGEPYRMASRIGLPLRLHSTAIGKAILAFLPEPELVDVLARIPLERQTASTFVTEETLRAELARVRSRGYAIDDEENEEGVRCVAAPLVDHQGRVAGGISVSSLVYVRSLAEARRIAPEVVRAAAELSAQLGARAA